MSDEADLLRTQLQLSSTTLRAAIPYAGVFCAFSSLDTEDIAAVRLHLFSLPELEALYLLSACI